MPETPLTIRLNKFVAQHLSIGRRQADFYIEKGRVKLNGQRAIVGDRVHPDQDTVSVDDTIISVNSSPEFLYIALNKPINYICSRKQQGDTPTIFSILPKQYQHLKPVGRLDKDSSGLILLTNDGDFAHRMTHPSFTKTKVYEVRLHKALEPLHQQMISDNGIALDDGISKFTVSSTDIPLTYEVTMHEGRNRQIRRTFGSLGYMINGLHRTQFGPYALDDLNSGEVKTISI